jgi:uncharacterized protein involved in type VI secretion and phage assembly
MTDPSVLEELFAAPRAAGGRVYGVVVGVVTNNQDDRGLGRVKVKLPWLSSSDESNWARVLAPMAGNQMGAYFLPEVDDEVLVAFEHGRVDRPFVLGALWNGKDKPPADNADGKNNKRVIKSRSGHTITLDDTDGSEKITIADGKKKSTLEFDVAKGALSLRSEGDITVKAKGKITIESENGDISISGSGIKAEAKQSAAIKGSPVNINDGALKVQ